MKLYEILPGKLYQRGDLLHFSDAAKAELIREKDIGRVIALVAPPDPFFQYSHQIEYIYEPVPDGKFRRETARHLEGWADSTATFIRLGKGAVLVYCEAGRNRSSLMSALIVSRVLDISGKAALEHVLDIRPNAFSNPEWREYLEALP